MNTITIEDKLTKKKLQFIIQSDNTVSFDDVKRVFGEICGLSYNDICLPIIGNKICPIDQWKNENYLVIRTQSNTETGLTEDKSSKIKTAIELYKKTIAQKHSLYKTVVKSDAKKFKIQELKKPVTLQIIWKNLTKVKSETKFIMMKGGAGGKRSIKFDNSNDITIDIIKEKAIELYFPRGVSVKGHKEEFNFSLQVQDEIVSDFKDKHDKSCSFDEFIEDIGIFPSKLKFQLLSVHKSLKSVQIESDDDSDNSMESEEKNLEPFEKPISIIPVIERKAYLTHRDVNGEKLRINESYYENIFKGYWIGSDVSLRKVYNLKSLRANTLLDSEIEINCRIRHPNIIHLLAMEVYKNSVTFLYEYFESFNLEYLILSDMENIEIRSDINIQNNIARQLTGAITYIHNLLPQITHGDIKPTNILISPKLGYTVKLCDFATIRDVDNIDVRIQSKDLQFRSLEKIYNLSLKADYIDIWSLGSSLVLLFTGVYPFNYPTVGVLDDDMKKQSIMERIELRKQPENLVNLSDVHYNALKRCFDYDIESRIKALDLMSIINNI